MMDKLSKTVKKETLVTPSTKDEIIESILTLFRFKSLTPI